MEIIILSDTHGWSDPLIVLKAMYPKADFFFHLGDSECSAIELDGMECVLGNNDIRVQLPEEEIVEAGGHRFFLTHGHHYGVYYGMERLVHKAKEECCDIVCYGHTHRYMDKTVDGVRLLNPGSIRYSRDLDGPSYLRLNIDNDGIQVQRLFYDF